MKKAMLLGGTARIVREPSQEEKRIAMLRSLADSHSLHLEMSKKDIERRPQQTLKGKDSSPNPFDAVVKQETEWIKDQLYKDIQKHGVGPEIHAVYQRYHGWIVKMLQWQPNGIAMLVDHELKMERGRYQQPFDEEILRKTVTNRFSKLLKRQAEQIQELGAPRILKPEEIDLTRYQMDKPLAAMLTAEWPEAPGLLRRGITTNDALLMGHRLANPNGRTTAELTYGRDVIQGKFSIDAGDVSLRWSKGALIILGITLPQTLRTACIGRPLKTVIEHPLFDGDMIITAIDIMRREGRDGLALNLKNTTQAMPAGW